MKKIYRYDSFWLVVSGILLGAVFLSGGEKADAQEELQIATGVQVSPVRFDWELRSGEERSAKIVLKNYSERNFRIEIWQADFTVSEDSGRADFFIPGQDHPLIDYDIINWISLSKEVALGPEEARTIPLTVRVPKEAPTGGYYGAVFFKVKDLDEETAPATSQIVVYPEMGVLLTLAVEGKEPLLHRTELRNFSASRKIFWRRPAALAAEIWNSGNVHYKGSARIQIEKFGEELKSFEFPDQVIYPERSRKYEADWEFSDRSLGRYRARFEFESEDGSVRISREITFWVVSWKAVLLLVLIFFAFFFTLWISYILIKKRHKIRKIWEMLRSQN